jgi:enoyl-CoA hydratase/carnithine racemase
MAFQEIIVEKRGTTGLITLNRPDRLNASSVSMREELAQATTDFAEDPGVRAIVYTGAGRAFCSGADMSNFEERVGRIETGADTEPTDTLGPWAFQLRALPKPTIGAINGTAVGIGVTMTLPMDIRIASDQAKFGLFFARVGLVPEVASSALLPQIVGVGRAIEWCFTARLVGAEEALQAGLVKEVVPGDQLLDRAIAVAEEVGKWPGATLAEIRRLLTTNFSNPDLVAVSGMESVSLFNARGSWEHKEALAAFREKRQPDFTPRSS